MEPLKIRIPGREVENNPADSTETLTIDKTYVIGAATRGEVVASRPEELDANKLIEFVYDDDTVWLADASTIEEVFPGTSAQLRSLENRDGVFDIPTEVYAGEQNRSGLLGKITLKLVKIFTKKALSPLVSELAGKLEVRQLEGKSGLFRLIEKSGGKEKFELLPPEFEPDGKYVLFLHGTASSTEGSFAPTLAPPLTGQNHSPRT